MCFCVVIFSLGVLILTVIFFVVFQGIVRQMNIIQKSTKESFERENFNITYICGIVMFFSCFSLGIELWINGDVRTHKIT